MPDAGKLEYELATRTEDTILRDIDLSSDGTWMTLGLSSTVGSGHNDRLCHREGTGGWYME